MKQLRHLHFSITFIFLLCGGRGGIDARRECRLDTSADFVASSPLLLTENLTFVRPSRETPTTLSFDDDDNNGDSTPSSLVVNCPGSSLRIDGRPSNASSLRLDCSDGHNFRAPDDLVLRFDRLSCDREPDASSRIVGSCTSRPARQAIEIGFETSSSSFAPTLDACFDPAQGRTAWAHARIQGGVASSRQQVNGADRGFRVAGYFKGISVSSAYTRKSQRRQLAEIFEGDQRTVDFYVPETGEGYLAKGHLVARADMFYKAEQSSTFYYVNTLPMWQSVNNGNWKLVEERVRRHAESAPAGVLEVWAGGLYDLELPPLTTTTNTTSASTAAAAGKRGRKRPRNHQRRPVYLARNSATGEPALTVPRLLFKALHVPELRAALVYVTANDPYLVLGGNGKAGAALRKDYVVCPEYEACRRLEPRFAREDRGYTYCCLYGDFARLAGVRELGLPELKGVLGPLI